MIKYLLTLIVLALALLPLSACSGRVTVYSHKHISRPIIIPAFVVVGVKHSVARLEGNTSHSVLVRYWVNGEYIGFTYSDYWGVYKIQVDLPKRSNRVKVAAYKGNSIAEYTATVWKY